MQEIEVFTAITNDKDTPRDDIMVMGGYDKFQSPAMNAKIYKIMPHKFMDCDVSIWMDGNIYMIKDPEWYVKEWLGDNDIAFFRHYKSKGLDWELKWIKYVWRSRDRDVYEEAIKQVEHYKKYDIGKDDMAMGGFIIRRHNKKVERFNEEWWAETCRWSQRDQLSLPVVLKKSDLKVNRINLSIKSNNYLTYNDHEHFES